MVDAAARARRRTGVAAPVTVFARKQLNVTHDAGWVGGGKVTFQADDRQCGGPALPKSYVLWVGKSVRLVICARLGRATALTTTSATSLGWISSSGV